MTFRFYALFYCSLFAMASTAPAAIITQWTFENQPVTGAPPYNNSPTPSTGNGTAIVLGMTNSYPTPGPSVASSDILSDPGSSDPIGQQAWRIRGQGSPDPTTANGWYSGAPQYSQGAEFDVSTVGFTGITISFDWQPTNRGVEDVELQYNSNIANSAGWTNAGLFSNTVAGGVWNNGNVVNLSVIGSIGNDANFGIRIVSAYHAGTSNYLDTNGTPLNNNSGNIRLDNVTVASVAAPEPSTGLLALVCLFGFGLSAQRIRQRSLPTETANE
jgi:hypothetical protein